MRGAPAVFVSHGRSALNCFFRPHHHVGLEGLGFRVEGLGFRVGVEGSGFWGSRFGSLDAIATIASAASMDPCDRHRGEDVQEDDDVYEDCRRQAGQSP